MFTIILISLLALNELIFRVLFIGQSSFLQSIVENIVLSSLAYSVVALCGMRLIANKRYNKESPYYWGVLLVALITIMHINKETYTVSNYKFPPQMIYIVIGIFASILLWDLTKKIDNNKSQIITWLSKK